MIDFRKVVEALRKQMQTVTPMNAHPALAIAARESFFMADRELAVQSFCYLFDHLFQVEQAREAVTMAAFCMPHDIRGDSRVVECLERASRLAEPLKDPQAEQAFNFLELIHQVDDNFIKMPDAMPPRARFWLSIARISRAKTAMEFGTGCGSNVMHAAQFEPNIHWIGVDLSAPQEEANRAQAKRLGLNVDFYTMEEAAASGVTADCVASLDVLEHTVYQDEMLDALEARLTPHGIVCCVTPNGPWSVWSDNINGIVPGSHVAVESLQTLVAKIDARKGRILDARILPGSTAEGNSNAAVAYEK